MPSAFAFDLMHLLYYTLSCLFVFLNFQKSKTYMFSTSRCIQSKLVQFCLECFPNYLLKWFEQSDLSCIHLDSLLEGIYTRSFHDQMAIQSKKKKMQQVTEKLWSVFLFACFTVYQGKSIKPIFKRNQGCNKQSII